MPAPGPYSHDSLFQAGRSWANTTAFTPLTVKGSVAQALSTLAGGSRRVRDEVNELDELGVVADSDGMQQAFDDLRHRLVDVIAADIVTHPFFLQLSTEAQRDPRAFAAALVTIVEMKFAMGESDIPAFEVFGYEPDIESQAAKLVSPETSFEDRAIARPRVEALDLDTGSDVEVFAQDVFIAAGIDLGRPAGGRLL